MAVTGAIAERIQGIIPVTWDALVNDSRYGENMMRTAIDTVKTRVTGTNISPLSESTYSVLVVDYLAKVTVLDLITPAIDFWMNQPLAETTTGTSEVVSFTERVEALNQLRKDLLEETRRLEPQIAPLINYTTIKKAPGAAINTLNDDFLTPSPQEFNRPFSRTTRS